MDFSVPLLYGRNLKYKVTNDKLFIPIDRVSYVIANVTLNWHANRKISNSGFNIERSAVKDHR